MSRPSDNTEERETQQRMYAVVRSDLGDVPRGKLLGTAGHAFLGAFLHAQGVLVAADTDDYAKSDNHPKIVLAVDGLDDLLKLKKACEVECLPHHLVTDFAHTVFTERTVTALGIGPIDKDEYRALGLSSLKLFR